MTNETIDPAARDQILAAQNDEYEASTPGADAWRDRMAQRHRFGRVLDKPPAKIHDISVAAGIAVGMVIVVLALVIMALIRA